MIVVIGRPRVTRPEPDAELIPGGLAADLVMAIASADRDVELVGSIGDDPEGDRVVVELGVAGVGHAALARDPATRTPVLGATGERPLPRLDAADIELALRYVPKCRVLVLGEDVDPEARAAVLEAGRYHGAAVVLLATPGTIDASELGDDVTLLELPTPEDDGAPAESGTEPDDSMPDLGPFAALVADYAVRLDQGEAPESAFGEALGAGAWEAATD